jgi:rhodanese-related sulfurtransferase
VRRPGCGSLSVALALSIVACDAAPYEPTPVDLDTVSPARAQELVRHDASVTPLDVRTPIEFAAGHLQNANNIDARASDFERQIRQLDRRRTYLVYCASGAPGGRSEVAAARLLELGLPHVLLLTGGFRAWLAAGEEVVPRR